ncbi:unnamed protein product, partial [Musa acuminata var. zebrina]
MPSAPSRRRAGNPKGARFDRVGDGFMLRSAIFYAVCFRTRFQLGEVLRETMATK